MPNNEPPAATALRDAIAGKVRGALAEASKTQRDLGEILNLPQSAVQLRLSGQRPFRAEELGLIARWLGVPIEQFVPAASSAGAA
ncbi:helix-turn-helix transcriptional regulator [Actinoplanes sp. NPDC051470]|uniref:helix-turn-helix domain-containing protein n=1 Tax=Actinoplanes sp. NPDC051470 TaxID=3157224 RepID=UPI00341BE2CD